MLQTQVAAYLLHSLSPSDVSLTAACNPPPLVAAALVSAFAVRLHRVITARRLQSTSGQDVSRISDAGQPDSAIMICRVEEHGRTGRRKAYQATFVQLVRRSPLTKKLKN